MSSIYIVAEKSNIENLLEENLLVCPEDKQELLYIKKQDVLYNPRLKQKYLIEDGIPILLIAEAVVVSEGEHKELMAQK